MLHQYLILLLLRQYPRLQHQIFLEDLLEMWPTLVPLGEVPFDASRLFGAAADVEILSLSL